MTGRKGKPDVRPARSRWSGALARLGGAARSYPVNVRQGRAPVTILRGRATSGRGRFSARGYANRRAAQVPSDAATTTANTTRRARISNNAGGHCRNIRAQSRAEQPKPSRDIFGLGDSPGVEPGLRRRSREPGGTLSSSASGFGHAAAGAEPVSGVFRGSG